MPILKVIWWLVMLLPRIFWFILKCLAYVCSFFQYDPWKRTPMQQLRDLEFRSVNFNTRERIRTKQAQKLATKDTKLVYKFVNKHSKWPSWLDKDFGEHRTNLGFEPQRKKSAFVGECKRRMGIYSVALQHNFSLVCTQGELDKLQKKLETTDIESRKVDRTHDLLESYGAAFYNACAKEGVILARTNCDCPIRGLRLDLSTSCCSEKLKYSKKAQKGIAKAMATVLKKKEHVGERVSPVKGGEAPEGHDPKSSDDEDEPQCTYCGEEEPDCECEEFQHPDTSS